jgi:hypothetical protein
MALEPIFIPINKPNDLQIFRQHYNDNLGLGLSDAEIRENVYGGKPLNDLYSGIEITANKSDLRKARGSIRLKAADNGLVKKDLVIKDVSLRQFLIAGLPYCNETSGNCPVSGKWDGRDNWTSLDPQYLLELCHSEISRWSLFFIKESKRDPKKGIAVGDFKKDQLSGAGKHFSRIEIVNNCTTAIGFEFRIRHKGVLYHGSFGAEGLLSPVYEDLSEYQAGTWAQQSRQLPEPYSSTNFFSGFYNRSLGCSGLSSSTQDDSSPGKTMEIDLSRYFKGATRILGSTFSGRVDVNREEIRYQRWGKGTEYEEKPQRRRLILGMYHGGTPSYAPPKTYRKIYSADSIELPDFSENGVYQVDDPVSKTCYKILPEFKQCSVSRLTNGSYCLEVHRQGGEGSYEFRRMVFGNLDLENIPQYNPKKPEKSFWTMHRFGYGARDTTQLYQKKFPLPHGAKTPVHFGYLLAGKSQNAVTAKHYICPESFGIERAIFTWEPKNVLVIDLISFERILPVWQGRIKFPKNYFSQEA